MANSYFNLSLDTTSPVLSLVLGINGYINSLAASLGITCTAPDVAEMKVWGIVGDLSTNFTGDGTTTAFTVSAKPATITTVTVGGNSTTDYTYVSATGIITFTTAPAADSTIIVNWKETLTESTASWEAFATSKTVTLPSGDGSKTVSAKVRDDVYNESAAADVTVILDMTAPVVSIISGPTPSKISKVSGKNVAQFVFQVAEEFVEYKVGVVANSSISQAAAVVIGTTNGSTHMANTGTFAASSSITCTITGADLEAASSGDGTKVIKVFVKDSSGNWSL